MQGLLRTYYEEDMHADDEDIYTDGEEEMDIDDEEMAEEEEEDSFLNVDDFLCYIVESEEDLIEEISILDDVSVDSMDRYHVKQDVTDYVLMTYSHDKEVKSFLMGLILNSEFMQNFSQYMMYY